MFEKFKQHKKNAEICIKQIERGEWIPKPSAFGSYIIAERKGRHLWISGSPWDCYIDDIDYFGKWWGIKVWRRARKLRKKFEHNTLIALEDD